MANGSAVVAFVLVTVKANESGNLVNQLFEHHGDSVVEAAAVYGESDVIVKIEADSIDTLHRLVMDKIQKMNHVQVTRTFLVIPHLHKMR